MLCYIWIHTVVLHNSVYTVFVCEDHIYLYNIFRQEWCSNATHVTVMFLWRTGAMMDAWPCADIQVTFRALVSSYPQNQPLGIKADRKINNWVRENESRKLKMGDWINLQRLQLLFGHFSIIYRFHDGITAVAFQTSELRIRDNAFTCSNPVYLWSTSASQCMAVHPLFPPISHPSTLQHSSAVPKPDL